MKVKEYEDVVGEIDQELRTARSVVFDNPSRELDRSYYAGMARGLEIALKALGCKVESVLRPAVSE